MKLPERIMIILDKSKRAELRFRIFRFLLRLISPICPCAVEIQMAPARPNPDGDALVQPVGTEQGRKPILVVPRHRRG